MKAAALGELRERVLIQAQASTVDVAGDPTYAYTDVATVWAKIVPVSAAERTEGGRLAATGLYDMTIRYRAGLNTKMRAVWRGRYLAFTDMINADRQRVLLTIRLTDVDPNAGWT
jgi:SPP1 family predicted phage head-tail adaptor